MKNAKRFIAMLLTMLLTVGMLAGCGGGGAEKPVVNEDGTVENLGERHAARKKELS